MARTKCTARKTTGGKLSSKLKAKNKDAKRNKSSQSDSSSSSEDESSNTSNFPPKQKKIRQSTSSQQRFNPNANIRMPEDVDDEMLKNIVDRVSFKNMIRVLQVLLVTNAAKKPLIPKQYADLDIVQVHLCS